MKIWEEKRLLPSCLSDPINSIKIEFEPLERFRIKLMDCGASRIGDVKNAPLQRDSQEVVGF